MTYFTVKTVEVELFGIFVSKQLLCDFTVKLTKNNPLYAEKNLNIFEILANIKRHDKTI